MGRRIFALAAAVVLALVGAVLLSGLTAAFNQSVLDNPQISPSTQERLAAATEEGIAFVPTSTVETQLAKAGVQAGEAKAIASSYDDSQITALKIALLAVAIFVVGSFWLTGALPGRPLVTDST